MMNKEVKKKPSSHTVSMKDEREVVYWTRKFGVDEETLRIAIKDTGSHSVSIIQQHLKDYE